MPENNENKSAENKSAENEINDHEDSGNAAGGNTEDDGLDFDIENLGYDPTIDEPVEITAPPPVARDAVAASTDHPTVNSQYLPPVGTQGAVPSCAAWASTYGLATFMAARAGDYAPTDESQIASPAYIYAGVMNIDNVPAGTCSGSQLTTYFDILAGGMSVPGGTPTLAQAPYTANCVTLRNDYGSQSLPPTTDFHIRGYAAVNAKIPDQVKQILASGKALVYGTRLYTHFGQYRGNPDPYVGSGTILTNKTTGKPVGHCMMIIDYDDSKNAFCIQNSFGKGWGSSGLVWMAYDTFTKLAQGAAFYIRD